MSAGHAVVVGGTKGLGLEIVNRFVARGLEVTVLSRNPSDNLAGLANVQHVSIDLEVLRRPEDLDVSAIVSRGPINYLVLSQRFRGEGDAWEGEIQVGLTATKILIEGLSGHFAPSGDRALVVISSVYAEYVGSSQPVGYHVVKAGINAMVRYYGWALGPKGIRANAIMPLSYIKDKSRSFYARQQGLAALYEQFVPLGRMGESSENADVVDFLCSGKASFITGQCIVVDGGVSTVWGEEIARKLSGL